MTAALSPTTCRSCGAVIVWATTVGGKHMPLDAEPAPAGNVYLDEQRVAHVLRRGEQPTGETFTAHHATCPDGQAWKRAR